MINQFFTSAELPKYHEGMLIVKMRPTAAPEPPRRHGRGMAAAAFDTPGMSALAMLERGGMIKRITPLSSQVEERNLIMGVRRGVAAMVAAAHSDIPQDLNAGVSLIEMDPNQVTVDVQSALAADPNIEFVSKVPVRYLLAKGPSAAKGRRPSATIAATPPVSTMWNMQKILWNQARSITNFQDADQVKVAVLDSGVDRNHPDLQGRVRGYSYLHPDIPDASGEQDIIGHGSHVAGTISALINNDIGINGICSCQLFVWKIFTDKPEFTGRGFEYFVDPVMYRRALSECVEQDIDVINLSIGGPGEPDRQEQLLFDSLLTKGTTIVAAMGNERRNGNPTSYPAAIRGVIAVGATNIDDTVAYFSSSGNHISLCAPGMGIWSTLPTYSGQTAFQFTIGLNGQPIQGRPMRRETNYDSWQGTSMAAPHVAGAVALLLANAGNLGPSEVRAKLISTVDRVSHMQGADFHPDYGAGRLNLLRLLTE
jgi:subtilisin family serine protease